MSRPPTARTVAASANGTLEAQQVVRGALSEHFFDRFAGDELFDARIFMPVVEHLRSLPECQLFRNS